MNHTQNIKFKDVFFDPMFLLSGLFILLSVKLNFITSEWLNRLYPFRSAPPDLIFDHIPLILWTQHLTDIAFLISSILIIFYIIKYDLKHFPYYFFAIGFIYFIRSLIIPLTPLGGFYGNGDILYGLSGLHQHGMFPSGHTAFLALMYLLINKTTSPIIKTTMLLLLGVEIISLLLSRGHYSIDIIGGVLLSYFVVGELSKFKSKLVLKRGI